MSSPEYPTIFTPTRIGPIELANRIALLPQGSGLAREGHVTDADIAYYRRRADGGVGLIITGGTAAHPSSQFGDHLLIEAYDPASVDPMRRRVDSVHETGAKIFGQLLSLGREMPAELMTTAPLAPSPIRSPRFTHPPREMTAALIQEVIASFALSSQHLRMAGYDGVEIHAAHGYLLGEFLSPATNHRHDSYGGSVEARARIVVEIVEAVRSAIGRDVALGVRMSADEELADGSTVADTIEVANLLEATGAVDYLSLTVGVRGSYVKDMSSPHGVAVDRVASVSAASSLPIIVAQRITTPALAEQILARGSAAVVGLSRALIADPDWVNKAARGTAERIRPCVGDLQDCRARMGGLRCMVNAEAGREVTWRTPMLPTDRAVAPRLVVVGGGPGGLEAARCAAEAGFQVVLFERSGALGGQVCHAAAAPTRRELLGLIDHLESEIARLGVDVRMNTEVDAQAIARLSPGFVVVATGGRPVDPPVSSDGTVAVVSASDLLAAGVGGCGPLRALVIDDGSGFWHACSAAELLAVGGASVMLATPAPAIGLAVPSESLAGLYGRLAGDGVTFAPFSVLHDIGSHGAVLRDGLTGSTRHLECDLVVWHGGTRPNESLPDLDLLDGVVVERIGDCVAPRRITEAVHEANAAIDRMVRSAIVATGPSST